MLIINGFKKKTCAPLTHIINILINNPWASMTSPINTNQIDWILKVQVLEDFVVYKMEFGVSQVVKGARLE